MEQNSKRGISELFACLAMAAAVALTSTAPAFAQAGQGQRPGQPARPAQPALPAVDPVVQQTEKLARDVERALSLRQVKDVQYSLSQYAQYGLIDEIMTLFSDKTVIEDVYAKKSITGKDAIRAYWIERIGTSNGLGPNQLYNHLYMAPTVTLNYDGRGAQGRWTELVMRNRTNGATPVADWLGGMLVNDYVKDGAVWKISRMRVHHQLEGTYYDGFFAAYPELPMVPYHFSALHAGRPAPTEPGDTDRTMRGKTLPQLETRVAAMNAEDEIHNLQNIYGYYVDRKMWDDVAELFASDGAMEIAGVGIWQGAKSIRRGLEKDGPAGLQFGQINDNIQLHTVVEVDPNGVEAKATGTQVGMLSPKHGEALWSVSTLVTHYVKQGGVWRIREIRIYPKMKADYYKGWGISRVVDARPTGKLAPDRPSAADQSPQTSAVIPAFLNNPVTGRPVTYPSGYRVVGADRLVATPATTDAVAESAGVFGQRLTEARRKLDVSKAYDAIYNLSGLFGDYLDDWLWDEFSAITADGGTRPQGGGFHLGRDNVYNAMTESHKSPPSPTNIRTDIRPHRRIQPVIHVAPDGKSARLRNRMFLYFANHERAGAWNTGIYANELMVLEDGVWKYKVGGIIEQTYIGSVSYEDGWARRGLNVPRTAPHKPMPAVTNPGPRYFSNDISRPADITYGAFDFRRMGPGSYPEVKPMWFHYRNPVTGRYPENYCPDYFTCSGVPQPKPAAGTRAQEVD